MIPRGVLGLIVFCMTSSLAAAHPLTKNAHDRTIVVRLQKGDTPEKIRVRVHYRLEVMEETVWLNDMEPHKREVIQADYFRKPMEFYRHFTRLYAPEFAARLIVRVNDKEIDEFRCLSRSETLRDEKGMNLGHLRCDFEFESAFDFATNEKTRFFFREQNYFLESGQIILSVVNDTGFAIEAQTIADEAFRKRAAEQPEPGDDKRLREITLVFAPMMKSPAPTAETAKSPHPAPRATKDSHDDRFSLLRLILHNEYGYFLTMVFAFLFGAAHALTPGHGKTLVAAYLVGERGTTWHALYLGLVTTLTHTGAVILIAVILALLSREMQQVFRQWIQSGLGLIMGLIVAGMGFWLLLQRLAGRADHVHLDGGHHHHHGPAPSESNSRNVGWRGLTILGMTGGMIPCWDAVGILGITVGTSEMWLVLPAVLVFSAGLAVVLVAIGILVVQVPRFVEARFGSGRLLKALPIVSAILVTLMGLWLCYESAHGM